MVRRQTSRQTPTRAATNDVAESTRPLRNLASAVVGCGVGLSTGVAVGCGVGWTEGVDVGEELGSGVG